MKTRLKPGSIPSVSLPPSSYRFPGLARCKKELEEDNEGTTDTKMVIVEVYENLPYDNFVSAIKEEHDPLELY